MSRSKHAWLVFLSRGGVSSANTSLRSLNGVRLLSSRMPRKHPVFELCRSRQGPLAAMGVVGDVELVEADVRHEVSLSEDVATEAPGHLLKDCAATFMPCPAALLISTLCMPVSPAFHCTNPAAVPREPSCAVAPSRLSQREPVNTTLRSYPDQTFCASVSLGALIMSPIQ